VPPGTPHCAAPPGATSTPSGFQTTILITAAAYTFNVSPGAFNKLNNGTGFESGIIAAEVTQFAASNCGMYVYLWWSARFNL
jgi:hypothetical protein